MSEEATFKKEEADPGLPPTVSSPRRGWEETFPPDVRLELQKLRLRRNQLKKDREDQLSAFQDHLADTFNAETAGLDDQETALCEKLRLGFFRLLNPPKPAPKPALLQRVLWCSFGPSPRPKGKTPLFSQALLKEFWNPRRLWHLGTDHPFLRTSSSRGRGEAVGNF